MTRNDVRAVIAAGAIVTAAALSSGCVRTVTTCVQVDRQMGHMDPVVGARQSAGASVCAEIGPR